MPAPTSDLDAISERESVPGNGSAGIVTRWRHLARLSVATVEGQASDHLNMVRGLAAIVVVITQRWASVPNALSGIFVLL